MEPLSQEEASSARAEFAKEIWEGYEPPEQPLAKEPDEVQEPEKEPEPAKDPWEGVDPVIKQRFDDLSAKLNDYDSMATRLKQAESRIGSITNQLHEAKKAAEVLKKEKEDAPTKAEIDAAAKSDEQWEDLKKEFPEWADAMDKRLAAESAKLEKSLGVKSLQEKIESLEKSIQGKNETDITAEFKQTVKELNKQIVSARYPDWETKVRAKEFGEWIASQGADVHAKANSEKAADAIYVLDLYEKHTAKPKKSAEEIAKERKQRLSQSETLPAGRPRQSNKSEEDMTDNEYRAKLAADIWKD